MDASQIADAVVDELAERYSGKLKKNPEWDRKADRDAWRAGREYPVPEYIDRSPEELRRESCYTVFTASDGGPSTGLPTANPVE